MAKIPFEFRLDEKHGYMSVSYLSCGLPTLLFLQYVQIGVYHMIMAIGRSFPLRIFSKRSSSTRLPPLTRCVPTPTVTYYALFLHELPALPWI